jgi:nucleotide-binding universal stress UspA family protein
MVMATDVVQDGKLLKVVTMLNLRKKILVAIDGSPQSDKAAEEAVRMAVGNRSQFKSCVYAMLVLPNAPMSTYTDFVPTAPVTETDKWDEIRRRIFYVVEKFASENDVSLEMIVEYGEPADKLIDFAKREQIDVIVIGSSGKGFFHRRIKGSVSHRVATSADCSVYIVRG